ncbi:MAG: HD domain-containing protein [Deltaproteobacteria bacterium]|uniref:HD domain-containing protein n=1 Tax=Candidatus Zymogenus saltonus TaxID=2844893 RepID=A0A9D8PNH8_9DELT|nr:HD domain-containing protein [Candidatus Zymogenus saltonus]
MESSLLKRLMDEVRRICGDEKSHGVGHAERTLDIARKIAAAEGGDIEVVSVAAILHDIGRKNIFGDPGHGARGAKMAREIIEGLEADVDVMKVVDIIARHDEPGRDVNGGGESLELTILRDADRLELLRISPGYLDLERLKTDEALKLVPYVLSIHYPNPEGDRELIKAIEKTKTRAEEILRERKGGRD